MVALERAATTGGLTIEGLSTRFLADYAQMKELRALAKYAGAIDVHVVPRLGSALAHRVRGDLDALRECSLRMKLVYLGLAQSGHLHDLGKPQQLDGALADWRLILNTRSAHRSASARAFCDERCVATIQCGHGHPRGAW